MVSRSKSNKRNAETTHTHNFKDRHSYTQTQAFTHTNFIFGRLSVIRPKGLWDDFKGFHWVQVFDNMSRDDAEAGGGEKWS